MARQNEKAEMEMEMNSKRSNTKYEHTLLNIKERHCAKELATYIARFGRLFTSNRQARKQCNYHYIHPQCSGTYLYL